MGRARHLRLQGESKTKGTDLFPRSRSHWRGCRRNRSVPLFSLTFPRKRRDRQRIPRKTPGANPRYPRQARRDLAHNAAHALCLAALRWHGYRPSQRYIVFQLLPHTLGLGPEIWRVRSKCHDVRNLGEYEGDLNIDERIVLDLIASCRIVADKAAALEPIRK
jgi:hypothetical protein